MNLDRSDVYRLLMQARERDGFYETKKETLSTLLNGIFTPFTSLGGYPLIFIDGGGVLCADCARRAFTNKTYSPGYFSCDIYYEGPPYLCDDCNCTIESAYGDPGDPDDPDEEEFNSEL